MLAACSNLNSTLAASTNMSNYYPAGGSADGVPSSSAGSAGGAESTGGSSGTGKRQRLIPLTPAEFAAAMNARQAFSSAPVGHGQQPGAMMTSASLQAQQQQLFHQQYLAANSAAAMNYLQQQQQQGQVSGMPRYITSHPQQPQQIQGPPHGATAMYAPYVYLPMGSPQAQQQQVTGPQSAPSATFVTSSGVQRPVYGAAPPSLVTGSGLEPMLPQGMPRKGSGERLLMESPVASIHALGAMRMPPQAQYMQMAPHQAMMPMSPHVATVISPKGVTKETTIESRRRKKRESEGSRRTNLNDLVTVVEQAVLQDMNRMDRFADKVTVLECTARLLQERYGLKAGNSDSAGGASEDYDSDSSNASDLAIDLSQPNLDRNTKKTLRERQRRRFMNRHLQTLRKMLKVDESKDKKAVLHAVIDFLLEQKRKRDAEKESATAQPTLTSASSSSSLAAAASSATTSSNAVAQQQEESETAAAPDASTA